MLPEAEPNAESAERHTVGLFTLHLQPRDTGSSSVPMRLPIGVDFSPPFSLAYLTRLAIWSKSLLPTKGNPVPPWEAGGLEGQGVAGATSMTDGPHTGICGVGVAGDGKSSTGFVLGVAGDFTKRAMAAMGGAQWGTHWPPTKSWTKWY